MRKVLYKTVEKIKTNFAFGDPFYSRKSCLLWGNVEKHKTTRQTSNDNSIRAHALLVLVD